MAFFVFVWFGLVPFPYTKDDLAYEYYPDGLIKYIRLKSTNLAKAFFEYNHLGLRQKKVTYDGSGEPSAYTWYVYDPGGALVSTYTSATATPGTGATQEDMPLYADTRVGMLNKGTGRYAFELTDHLGNVRSVIAKNTSSNAVDILSYSDYYPGGGVLPGRNYVSSPSYKFNGVGGNEKDAETNFTNFELRQYDPRLMRWFNPDPYDQYFSPYLAMGNNPISGIDEDGGWNNLEGIGAYSNYMDEGFGSAREYAVFMQSYDPSTTSFDRYNNRVDAASNGDYFKQVKSETGDIRDLNKTTITYNWERTVNSVVGSIGPDPLSVPTGTVNPEEGEDRSGYIQNSSEYERIIHPWKAYTNDAVVWILTNLTPFGSIDDAIDTYKSDKASTSDKITATVDVVVMALASGSPEERGGIGPKGGGKLINGIPENPGTVRRFLSKEEMKTLKDKGFKFDPNDSRGGMSSTSRKVKAKNPDAIKKSTGAHSATHYVDINVKGKNVALKGKTKGGLPDWKIRSDINPVDIINFGKVSK